MTAIQCPSWCEVDHKDMPPGAGFHACDGIGPEAAQHAPSRLWQTDQPGCPVANNSAATAHAGTHALNYAAAANQRAEARAWLIAPAQHHGGFGQGGS